MTSKVKIILFNGPPRSGKDTAVNHSVKMLQDLAKVRELACGRYSVKKAKIAAPLKTGAHALFGCSVIHQDSYEAVKEEARPEFFGMSPREVYIWLSEECMKVRFGQNVFASICVNRIKRDLADMKAAGDNRTLIICFADCGFKEEAQELISAFGAENVLILKLQRDNCDFKNDSRNYLDIPEVRQKWILNGTLTYFKDNVFNFVEKWLNNADTSTDAPASSL